ncbi:hypothetical protein FKM82_026283 [Ascaphus truei]
MTTPKKVLTLDNINPRVRDIKVSFQGSLGIRASEIEREIHQGVARPFGEMTACHIGDLHATGQKPCTFLRQVTSHLLPTTNNSILPFKRFRHH